MTITRPYYTLEEQDYLKKIHAAVQTKQFDNLGKIFREDRPNKKKSTEVPVAKNYEKIRRKILEDIMFACASSAPSLVAYCFDLAKSNAEKQFLAEAMLMGYIKAKDAYRIKKFKREFAHSEDVQLQINKIVMLTCAKQNNIDLFTKVLADDDITNEEEIYFAVADIFMQDPDVSKLTHFLTAKQNLNLYLHVLTEYAKIGKIAEIKSTLQIAKKFFPKIIEYLQPVMQELIKANFIQAAFAFYHLIDKLTDLESMRMFMVRSISKKGTLNEVIQCIAMGPSSFQELHQLIENIDVSFFKRESFASFNIALKFFTDIPSSHIARAVSWRLEEEGLKTDYDIHSMVNKSNALRGLLDRQEVSDYAQGVKYLDLVRNENVLILLLSYHLFKNQLANAKIYLHIVSFLTPLQTITPTLANRVPFKFFKARIYKWHAEKQEADQEQSFKFFKI